MKSAFLELLAYAIVSWMLAFLLLQYKITDFGEATPGNVSLMGMGIFIVLVIVLKLSERKSHA